MQRLFVIILISLMLNPVVAQFRELPPGFDAPKFGDQRFPAEGQVEVSQISAKMSGPGGCDSMEKCMDFCMQNPEQCQGYASSSVAFASGYDYVKDIDHSDMIVSNMFTSAKYQPQDFIQYCPDASAMVDAVISAMKEDGVFNVDCSQLEKDAELCVQRSQEGCEQIKSGPQMLGPFGLSCDDLNQDAVVTKCIEQNREFNRQFNEENSAETRCEQQWNQQQQFSSQFCDTLNATSCDKDSYIESERDKTRDFCENVYPDGIENRTDLVDDCVDNTDYDLMWEQHAQICESNMNICNKDRFMESCLEQDAAIQEQTDNFIKEACQRDSSLIYNDFSAVCAQQESHYTQCIEHSGQMCKMMGDALAKCNSITEDEIRAKMIVHAERFCKFASYQSQGEQGQLVATLQQAKQHLPSNYQVMVDEKAENVLQTEEQVDSINDKGLTYALKWLIGAAAEDEMNDAEELRKSASELRSTVEALELAVTQIEDNSIKTSLRDQIKNIEKRADEMEEMANKKEKRADGFLSIFGD